MIKKILSLKLLSVVAMALLLQLALLSVSYAAGPPDDGRGGTYYTVQYGDTLFSIGRRFGVNPYRIAEHNGLYNPHHIYAGQTLHIPTDYYGDYHQPDRPDYRGCGYGRCGGGYHGHYGYDGTGYYYDNYYNHTYQRYSYTCGYHYNCY